MAGDQQRWYFSKDRIRNSPSRECKIDADKELSYRQQAANVIQEMGQRLQVTQLCINTAIVYMHRFYMFHSFTKYNRNNIAATALFLAAKVEEQPRKLEHVIKVNWMIVHREQHHLDVKSQTYQQEAKRIVEYENILLQTLGFDIGIEHPHTFVVKCCQLVRASKDIAQTSYFMATNSLHLTTLCLRHRPTLVACVCIHLATKWSGWAIPRSREDKDWFFYIDKDATLEMLEELTNEFLEIYNRCPSRLKKNMGGMVGPNITDGLPSGPSGTADGAIMDRAMTPSTSSALPSTSSSSTALASTTVETEKKDHREIRIAERSDRSERAVSSLIESRRELSEKKSQMPSIPPIKSDPPARPHTPQQHAPPPTIHVSLPASNLPAPTPSLPALPPPPPSIPTPPAQVASLLQPRQMTPPTPPISTQISAMPPLTNSAPSQLNHHHHHHQNPPPPQPVLQQPSFKASPPSPGSPQHTSPPRPAIAACLDMLSHDISQANTVPDIISSSASSSSHSRKSSKKDRKDKHRDKEHKEHKKHKKHKEKDRDREHKHRKEKRHRDSDGSSSDTSKRVKIEEGGGGGLKLKLKLN